MSSRNKTPRYMRGNGRGKGRLALIIFIIVAVICEGIMIRGAIHGTHRLMMGIMCGVIGVVFIAFAFGIHFLAKAGEEYAASDEKKAGKKKPAKKTAPAQPSGDAKSDALKHITVAAAVIRDGDRILATQRGYGAYKDWWEFPGGKLEPFEKPREACRREIREELNAEIEIGDEIAVTECDYPEFHVELHCFMCTLAGGDPKLLEHEDARWLTKDELDSVKWLEADLEVIEKLKQIL